MKWLKPIQYRVDDLTTKTETGILLYYDELALAIIKHYAFSGREAAQLVFDKFALIGFNAWVHQQTGWQEPVKPIATSDNDYILEILEAHTKRTKDLNRTIHTAVHRQIEAIKDTLKILENRLESASSTITIENSSYPNPEEDTRKKLK